MKRKIVWLVVSYLMVLTLLAASCAKAEAPATKEAAPATKEAAPATREAAPVVKEAVPATSEAPKYGGTLIVGTNANILNWDELYQGTWSLATNLALVNEELMSGDWTKGAAGSGERVWQEGGYSDSVHAAGVLAESYELPDATTIIFHIRKGVHWALDQNSAASRLVGGRELTADDIVFNLRRQFVDNPSSPNYNWAGAARPLDVSATDKYTVMVKAPQGFLGLTWECMADNVRIMAPEVAKKYGDYSRWENSVGTGPFILTDHVPMSSATYTRNPSYREQDPIGAGKGNQLPYLDGVKILIIPDMSTRMAALRTGKMDWDMYLYAAGDALQLIKTNPQLKYMRSLGGSPIIGMRIDKPELPFKDSKVRRALNLAMNNQEICDTIYGGEGEILGYKVVKAKVFEGIYTPLEQLPTESRELFEYHPDKAKQLLAEAGYPNGFKTLAQISASDPVLIDRLTMIKAYWAKVNVDMEIKVVDQSIWNTMRSKHTYEQIFAGGRSIWNPHIPASNLKGFDQNTSMVDDPKMEDYYAKMTLAFFDRPKRDALMKEMNLYVLDKSWYITPPIAYVYTFWQPWLKNYYGEQDLGIFNKTLSLKYAWLDQELKKSMGH
ncbi:MAG: hypothetical protein HY528_00210 [Chloroflexi bacterium]|nr:hypothetical protein [Chloroflexota bacterium]